MRDAIYPPTLEIRPAVPEDADGIARTFLEGAEYHAELDPERYWTPELETISSRYREARKQASRTDSQVITLVAELGGEIVGFIDASLEQSPDPMHREMVYCHIAEIAVRCGHRSQGIGGRLLRAAEDWGAGWVRRSHHWNITPPTSARARSIGSAWAITPQPSQS